MPIAFSYNGKTVSVQLQGEPLCLGGHVVYSAMVEYEGVSKSIFILFGTHVKADVDGNDVLFPIEKVLLACLTDKKFTSMKTPSRKIRELLQKLVVNKITDFVKKNVNLDTMEVNKLFDADL
jgi:hypothetical protein